MEAAHVKLSPHVPVHGADVWQYFANTSVALNPNTVNKTLTAKHRFMIVPFEKAESTDYDRPLYVKQHINWLCLIKKESTLDFNVLTCVWTAN